MTISEVLQSCILLTAVAAVLCVPFMGLIAQSANQTVSTVIFLISTLNVWCAHDLERLKEESIATVRAEFE